MSKTIHHLISTEEKREYEALQKKEKKFSKLENYAKDYIRSLISQLNSLVQYKKYDKKVWLEQYERIANKNTKNGNARIDRLAKDLDFNVRNLSIEEKGEIGFHLYCDYLRSIAHKIEAVKKDVNCRLCYRNDFRTGEVLALFGNPGTKEGLEAAYKSNLSILKNKLASLNESLVKEQAELLKANINADIEAHQIAVKGLKNLYDTLDSQWELKVNPLDPGVDDRKLKDKPVKSKILKSLVKEEGDNSKQSQKLLRP